LFDVLEAAITMPSWPRRRGEGTFFRERNATARFGSFFRRGVTLGALDTTDVVPPSCDSAAQSLEGGHSD